MGYCKVSGVIEMLEVHFCLIHMFFLATRWQVMSVKRLCAFFKKCWSSASLVSLFLRIDLYLRLSQPGLTTLSLSSYGIIRQAMTCLKDCRVRIFIKENKTWKLLAP